MVGYMLHYLKFILLQATWIGICYFSLCGILWGQKSTIDKLTWEGITYLNPTPKTLHYLYTHLNDSLWRSTLIPLGFIEIPWEHKVVALQFEKGAPGKLYQVVTYDHIFNIVSVFWQDPSKKISLINPLKNKIKGTPILQSTYTTYELNQGGKKFWFSIRSQVKNGALEEEATLENAR
ncbi:MAG: hypothetical protein N2167_11145 [Flavobacteriales bacterium]|nr:hypothetical protein [Flavobacteriales bacterium]